MKKRKSTKTSIKSSVKSKKISNKIHWDWIFNTFFKIVGILCLIGIVGYLLFVARYLWSMKNVTW
jgi:hypothetical protein